MAESDVSMTTSKPLHISFNQDHSRFVVSTASGFQIYTCDPFREFYKNSAKSDQSSAAGGIGQVEMLFNSAYLALIGGGPQPQYPVNKVMIWNAHAGRCIGEIQFRSVVKSVKLRRDIIVVVLMNKIYTYNLSDLSVRDDKIVTADNPKGLCAVSQQSGVDVIIAYPGFNQGQVMIRNFAKRNPEFVLAHESRIACLALSQDGKLLATTSSKGTLIRVFNTPDRSCLREVRRGADRAEIYSLAFSSTAEWVASSSDKGTVHVFNLKQGEPEPGSEQYNNASEPKSTMISSLSFIKGVVPRYFRSEWSFAQFRLPEAAMQQHIVGFGHQKNTILIVSMDGSFYRCQFDPVRGGEMTQLEYSNFLKPQQT